jgi:hypothetical protein
MVGSGTCAICGKPVDPDEAEVDMETGSLAHASCIEKERASETEEEPQPSS